MVALLVHPTWGGTNEEGAANIKQLVFNLVCYFDSSSFLFWGKVLFLVSLQLACLPYREVGWLVPDFTEPYCMIAVLVVAF